MPTIPNFPQDLLDQHHHWHNPSAHPGAGPGRTNAAGTTGGGLEFLTFHRNYVAQVMSWYNSTTFTQPPFDDPPTKASLVAPWTSVPAQLQALAEWASWSGDANRLDTLSPDFATADELGTFIELGIHNNFLHGAAAQVYAEPAVATLHSPQSSYFYKIHGLVDYWWSQWQRRHKRRIKELIKEISADVLHNSRIKELIDVTSKRLMPEVKDRIGDVKLIAFDVADDPRAHVLPEAVTARLARVEEEVFPLRAKTFIRPDERPKVGGDPDKGGEGHGGHGHGGHG